MESGGRHNCRSLLWAVLRCSDTDATYRDSYQLARSRVDKPFSAGHTALPYDNRGAGERGWKGCSAGCPGQRGRRPLILQFTLVIALARVVADLPNAL